MIRVLTPSNSNPNTNPYCDRNSNPDPDPKPNPTLRIGEALIEWAEMLKTAGCLATGEANPKTMTAV